MLEVSQTAGARTAMGPWTGADASPQPAAAPFGHALDAARSRQAKDELQELLDDVFRRSDQLADHQSRRNLDDYRDAVRRFLSQVIDRSVSLKRDVRNGNLLSVRTVNSALERLGGLLLDREQDRLRLLDEIGEIRGLLVSIQI